ncbi:hypothetical protein OHB41_47250 [Streptomyces sp. NBC_01571]|uniref:hypothetical protein n=1 Tax=Streptomyces sp. NBC_01571 TaxID=2975883 RepID=UPI00224CD63A|nr:hypothetical protein [Streptomyces sp. NBC_01571]MCX4580608.1 hypothetical protein [Streptomyces sp. NBC_01571]
MDETEAGGEWAAVPAEVGDLYVQLVEPVGRGADLLVVPHVHQGGLILGNAATHSPMGPT